MMHSTSIASNTNRRVLYYRLVVARHLLPTTSVNTTTTTIRRGASCSRWFSARKTKEPSLNGWHHALTMPSSSNTPTSNSVEESTTTTTTTTAVYDLNEKQPEQDEQCQAAMAATTQQQQRFAMLVDSENAQLDAMDLILKQVRNEFQGNVQIRRVYGDFSSTIGSQWRDFCLKESFVPVHGFTHVKGKGSTDALLLMDAMELLYTQSDGIDGFCLVTSDSDFVRLAQRLRESGKHVVGFGHAHTHEAFVACCESFVCVNDLMQQERDRQDAAQKQQQQRIQKERERAENERIAAEKAAKEEEQERKKSLTQQRGMFDSVSQYFTSIVNKLGMGEKEVSPLEKRKGALTKTGGRVEEAVTETDTPRQESSSIPRSELDSIHATWLECRNDDGYCHMGALAGKGGLGDVRRYGYTKFSEVILDHPEEFHVKIAADNTTLFVKSLQVQKSQLRCIHDAIREYSDVEGWAQLSTVAAHTKLRPSAYGYDKFSALVIDFPDEFEVKVKGSNMLIKSTMWNE